MNCSDPSGGEGVLCESALAVAVVAGATEPQGEVWTAAKEAWTRTSCRRMVRRSTACRLKKSTRWVGVFVDYLPGVESYRYNL